MRHSYFPTLCAALMLTATSCLAIAQEQAKVNEPTLQVLINNRTDATDHPRTLYFYSSDTQKIAITPNQNITPGNSVAFKLHPSSAAKESGSITLWLRDMDSKSQESFACNLQVSFSTKDFILTKEEGKCSDKWFHLAPTTSHDYVLEILNNEIKSQG